MTIPQPAVRRVALVGAECEESLPLRYLQASLRQADFDVRLLAFNREDDIEDIARALARSGSPLAGFSMVFTARADQFARLARRARELGYAGHITAGGHFAAFNAETLLRDEPAFDSVAVGEGERILVDLASRLDAPAAVRGLVWRRPDRTIIRNPPAPPVDDLDTLPEPARMKPPDHYLGLPIANMISSRGCSHACRFCSIAAWHKLCGGRRHRARSADAVAREMARLYADGYRLFNFHDDNFLPGPAAQNRERVDALASAIAGYGIGRIGFAIKSRPDAVDADLFRRLRDLGLFRVFLGIEAGTAESLVNLGRRQTVAQNVRALDILNGLDLHVCFNLLLFNPDSTLDDFRANVRFMETHAVNPMNFCRTEVYSGTPLEARLRAEGRLEGSYWGYGYHIRDPRAQRAFELMHRHLFDRHHSDENVHHLAMRVDYERQLLADFFECPVDLRDRAKLFVREVNRASAGFLLRIADMAERPAEPSTADLEALRRDLALDTRRREQESLALLAAIRGAAVRESPAVTRSLARLGLAASLVMAAGTSAFGQHMRERVAVPVQPPVPPPAPTNAVTPDSISSTNAPAMPGRPPDGNFNAIAANLAPLAQVIARHTDNFQDVELELWLDKDGKISFAAVYKAGRAKDVSGEGLTLEVRAKAEKLLKDLGAETFADREKASAELKKLGPTAIPVLQAHRAKETDPEVTQRCDQIIAGLDCFAAVRDYDGMIREIKAIKPTTWNFSDAANKRYVGPLPASTLRRWSAPVHIHGGPHIFEMAPAPRD